MGVQQNDPNGLQSEINVTPLVDVVLVLLIIFIIIIPVALRGYDVDIPAESVSAPPPEEQRVEQIVLGIDAKGCPALEPLQSEGLPVDCRVRLNAETIRVDQLARRTAEIFSARDPSNRVLFLAAEDRLNYEIVMRVVDVARSSVEDLRIGLVVRPS